MTTTSSEPAGGTATSPEGASAVTEELVRHVRMLHVLKGHLSHWLPPGVDWGAFVLLSQLVTSGAKRQGELAQCVMLDPSTVSRQVGQLVRTGLVERRPHPLDGRAVQLAATDEGQAVHDRVRRRRDAATARMLDGWSEEDVTTLVTLLRRLNEGAEAQRPAFSEPPAARD